jgi:hypothetical protein
MGLLDTSLLRELLEKGTNPNNYAGRVDSFVTRKQLNDSINNSLFDVEINPTNFSNLFGENRDVTDPSRTATGQLSEFISKAEYTLFNRFKVYINGPDLSQFGYPKTGLWEELTNCAEVVSMPRKSFEAIPYQLNSLPVLPLPIMMNYDNVLLITFRVNRNYAQRNLFLKWQELIYPSIQTLNPNVKKDNVALDANSGFNYYDVYAKNFTITVTSLNTQGQTTMLTKFYGVYPLSVEGMEYNWSNSEYVKQNVNFSFYKFHTVAVDKA